LPFWAYRHCSGRRRSSPISRTSDVFLFIAVLGVSALFRETSLVREIGLVDMALALVPLGMSVAISRFFGSILDSRRQAMETLFRTESARRSRPDETEGPIIEGEYERLDDDEDDRH